MIKRFLNLKVTLFSIVSLTCNAQDALTNVVIDTSTIVTTTVTEKIVDIRDKQEFQIIRVPEYIIEERLKGLENVMPMPYNEHVQKYIDYFLFKRPSFVKEMLEKSQRYFPVFEEYLVKHGIPAEMKYLALLESGLDPNAVSRANAVGMWQFMSFTGKEMGLKINEYLDERRHVEKSTNASFIYLTQLYKQFDDWQLALAAYNSGPGRVKRAIRRSGITDYWNLHNFLPSDTRAYVPQWEALNYLMNYSAEHGIFPDESKVQKPIEVETMLLSGHLDLKVFSELNCMTLEEFKDLNPHLIKDEIPSYATNVEIHFPRVKYPYFAANREVILDSASKINKPSFVDPSSDLPYHLEYVTTTKYHKVRRGEHLNSISTKYGVRVSDLKAWNNLRSSKILVGQRLAIKVKETKKIYHEENTSTEGVASKETEKTTEENHSYSNVKIASNAKSEEAINVVSDHRVNAAGEKKVTKTVKKYYKVKRGDNLTVIATRLGVSVGDMKRWNNLKDANDIYYGFNLIYFKTMNEIESTTPKVEVYTVQRGDTLWSIAQRYPNVSMEQIKKLNNLNGNTVKIGQKLKIGT